MSLALGTRLGPYQITAPLGAGGMGEVYRAHDTRLDRDVAVKVLPDAFATDADRIARFEREAKLLAALNHPYIAQIYGIEDGRALVMELVDGPTLADRIAQGALPADEALPIARQIAEALEAAHEQGIIHRDLKPANIKVRHDGTVKVLDFGLAKLNDPNASTSSDPNGLSLSPTITSPALTTGVGTLLGTAAYMSPEQARGKAADKRADIWAFGCVLYEMLTGRTPFPGGTVSDMLASVLARDPDLKVLPASLHPRIRELIERCLDKDPKQRRQSAGDLRVELEHIGRTGRFNADTPAPASGPARWRSRWLWPAVAASVVAAAAAAWLLKPTSEPFPIRIVLDVEDEQPLGFGAVAADGRSVVYSGLSTRRQRRVLYLRRLDELQSTEVAGTEGANGEPAFSPDGKSIAFIADRRRIVKVGLDGSAPAMLGTVPDDGGIAWGAGGDIVLGAGIDEGGGGLLRVNAAGGPVTPLTKVDTQRGELSHQTPRMLADGTAVLFTLWFGTAQNAQLAAASLRDGAVVPLGITAVKALGVVDGQLVYAAADGQVMAVAFDVRNLRATDTPVPVGRIDVAAAAGSNEVFDATLSDAGGLAFVRGGLRRRLVWVDRLGASRPVLADAREYGAVRVSPNGRQAAVVISGDAGADLWTLDINAGTLSRLTTTGTARNASWSADGRRVLYASTHSGRAAFWWQPADGSGPPALAVNPPHNPWHADLSPDGRHVVFNAIYGGGFNLETVTVDEQPRQRDLAASAAAWEQMGRFSPDGKWLAYSSDESGANEVYVRRFADPGDRAAVSAGGGTRAIWDPDGKRLYYLTPDGVLMSATLVLGSEPRVVSRQALFRGNYTNDYDVAPDGTFLMVENSRFGRSLVVVPQWRTHLRQLTSPQER